MKKLSEHATVSKLLKKELKRYYHDVKFDIHGYAPSGGYNHIDIICDEPEILAHHTFITLVSTYSRGNFKSKDGGFRVTNRTPENPTVDYINYRYSQKVLKGLNSLRKSLAFKSYLVEWQSS